MKPFPTGIAICLGISTMIFVASCTKSTTPPTHPGGGTGPSNPPSNGNYLSSIRDGQSSDLLDSFSYDNSNRLTKIVVYYGSGSGIINIGSIKIDGSNPSTSTVTFSYAGNSTAPASYTVVNSFDQKSHLHQLQYDGQNRIIKDTALDNSGYATTWTYPNGNIAARLNSGSDGQILDTLFLTNGNITAQYTYLVGNTGRPDTVVNSTTSTYSSIVNPNYHQAIASTYGPLLSHIGINGGATDYVSVNGISTATEKSQIIGADKLPGATDAQTYTWTTDSKNRAATLKLTDSKIGDISNLKFSYY
ncbi:MAG: hypothetical protein J0H74_06530 [Chitinophagaceae bacterium]|nr:hypothetical protein [Chitinophagaceae bacterium]